MVWQVGHAVCSVLKAVGKAAVAYLAVVGSVPAASGHGFLERPAARNVQHNSDWCPQCLNAGGPWLVYAHGKARYGVCGDKWDGPRDHEAGGKYATPPRIADTYFTGQTFTAKAKFTANHKGRWSLRLCPVPGGGTAAEERRATTQRCFDKHVLHRADGTGPYTEVPPSASVVSAKYVLPKGVRCRRCVLQWTYETGNSCNPPGVHRPDPGLSSCKVSTNGEQFWNCADVRIV